MSLSVDSISGGNLSDIVPHPTRVFETCDTIRNSMSSADTPKKELADQSRSSKGRGRYLHQPPTRWQCFLVITFTCTFLLTLVSVGPRAGLVLLGATRLPAAQLPVATSSRAPDRTQIARSTLPDHASWGRLRHQRHRDRGLEARRTLDLNSQLRNTRPVGIETGRQFLTGQPLQARSPPLV